MKRIISMLICLAIVVGAFAGCSTLEGDDKGAIINVYLAGQVYDFDPAMNYHNSDMVKFFNLIYEGLTRLDSKGNWEKALMKDYKKSFNDETGEYKVTITLNSTQWSDGRSVQAQDIVYAWKRILEPTFACSAASMLFDIKNARDVKYGDVSIDDLGVVAVDTYVFEISFEYAVDLDAFFRTCASPALVPLREEVARNDNWATKTSSMVTNGPFAVKEIDWDKDGLVRIERNSNYYLDDEKSEALDKYVIPWRIITTYKRGDLEAQLAAFDEGQIFYLGEIPLSARAERAKQATVSDEMSTHTYYFNTENKLFSDARVRRALSMAIDRNEIVELLTFAKPATGLIPYGVDDGGSKKDFRTVADSSESGALISSTADVDGAKALLKEAGVKSGSFTLTVRDDNEADAAVAEYVTGVWGDLGFKVKIEYLKTDIKREGGESNTKVVVDNFANALEAGDFDVIAVDMQMLNTDAFSALSVYATKFSGGGVDMDDPEYPFIGNLVGYENSEYSDLIEKIYEEHDSAVRAELLHEAEAMLMEDMPVMPLVFNQDAYLINSKVLSGEKDTYWGTRDFSRLKMKNYMKYKEVILEAEEAELDG